MNEAKHMGQVDDVLLHCFSRSNDFPQLLTLCGQEYSDVVFGHWPAMFSHAAVKNEIGVELCKVCADHPDLPLLILGDVG